MHFIVSLLAFRLQFSNKLELRGAVALAVLSLRHLPMPHWPSMSWPC